MRSKLIRFVGLFLIVVASSLPALAIRPCSCDYCESDNIPAETLCHHEGNVTTCGIYLSIVICP